MAREKQTATVHTGMVNMTQTRGGGTRVLQTTPEGTLRLFKTVTRDFPFRVRPSKLKERKAIATKKYNNHPQTLSVYKKCFSKGIFFLDAVEIESGFFASHSPFLVHARCLRTADGPVAGAQPCFQAGHPSNPPLCMRPASALGMQLRC